MKTVDVTLYELKDTGYKDKTKKEAAVMRSKEESCLQKYYNNNL